MSAGAGDPQPLHAITGVVLAGGRARRMGGQDKGLVEIAGRPMVAWVLDRLAPQVGAILVNANRNLDAYRSVGPGEVVPDAVGEFAGPLAGMVSAMRAAATEWILTVPCDSPLIAPDLAARLLDAASEQRAEIAVARDAERVQPVFALLARRLAPDLEAFLGAGERKIDRWYATRLTVEVDFSDRGEMFHNINTPQERDALEARMREQAA